MNKVYWVHVYVLQQGDYNGMLIGYSGLCGIKPVYIDGEASNSGFHCGNDQSCMIYANETLTTTQFQESDRLADIYQDAGIMIEEVLSWWDDFVGGLMTKIAGCA